MHPQVFEEVLQMAVNHYNGSLDECYVFDGFVGASPSSRRRVRFVHELGAYVRNYRSISG